MKQVMLNVQINRKYSTNTYLNWRLFQELLQIMEEDQICEYFLFIWPFSITCFMFIYGVNQDKLVWMNKNRENQ